MSPLSIALLGFSALPPQNWFDDCVKAHRVLRSAKLQLEVVQVLEGKTTCSKFDLSYVRPNQMLVRVREPEQSGRAESDRTFALIGSQFIAYDAVVHERLQRKATAKGTLMERFAASLGSQLDDSIAGLIEPDRLAAFLLPFRSSVGWKESKASGITTLVKRSGTGANRNTTSFRFESSTRRLRGLRIDVASGRLEWRIAYSAAPKSITYRPPSDAAVVSSFTLRPLSSAYTDLMTRKIAERAMAAYDRLRHVTFRIEGSGGGVRAWISGDNVREENANVAYVWNKTTASIRDNRKKVFYSGRAGIASLVDALAQVGSRMDPVVRQIVTRQNPVRVLLIPGVKVRRTGQIKVKGVLGDILEFRSSTITVSMVIRKDNGLLASVQTTVQDQGGGIISDSLKFYVYGPVGKALDKATFALSPPKDFKKAPIRSLLRHP